MKTLIQFATVCCLVAAFGAVCPSSAIAQSGYVPVPGPPVVSYVPERVGLFGLRTAYRPVVTPTTAYAPVYGTPATVVTQMPVITTPAPTLGRTTTMYAPPAVTTQRVTTYYTPIAPAPTAVPVYQAPPVYIAPTVNSYYVPTYVPPVTVQRPVIIYP